MAPPLSHFPDLCLLRMFKYIPLVDIIRIVRLVCKNWARVHCEELKRRRTLLIVQDCPKQLQLKSLQKNENLFGSDLIEQVKREDGSPLWKCRSLDQIKFNALLTSTNFNVLPVRFSLLLTAILPNITHLTLIQSCVTPKSTISTLKQITQMISHYATRLVFFNLDFAYLIGNDRKTEARHVNALLNAINQVSSLRHLHLSINAHHPTKVALNLETKLTILSQLNTFVLDHFGNSKLFRDSLRQYATGHVRVTMKQEYSLDEWLLYDRQFASKFSGIRISGKLTTVDNNNLRLLCSRFVSLSTLELSIDSMPMAMLSQCLSQLTQLVHFKLLISPSLHYDYDFACNAPGCCSSWDSSEEEEEEEHNEEDEPQLEIAQIPSVCLLTLTIRCRSTYGIRNKIKPLYLFEIFPNLQVLHFNHQTSTCYYSDCEFYNYRYQLEAQFPQSLIIIDPF